MSDEIATIPGGEGGLLDGSHRKRADIRLIERAVKGRWPISDAIRSEVTQKMRQIVAKDLIEVPSKDGTMHVDNDRNQIAAAKVLVQIDAINQTDDMKAIDVERIDSNRPTELHHHVHAHAHFDFDALARELDGQT